MVPNRDCVIRTAAGAVGISVGVEEEEERERRMRRQVRRGATNRKECSRGLELIKLM